MTDEERRLAKISRTLNNTSLNVHTYSKTEEDAYSSAIKNLATSLRKEKSQNKEEKNSYNLSIQAKINEDSLKELAYKHHSKVLQAQIKENKLKKQILQESTSFTPFYYPVEVPTPKNHKLREDLFTQIAEKAEQKKALISSDVSYQQKLIESSNKNLEDEYASRIKAKENAYRSMVESWEDSIKLKKLAKELEKIRIYGPKPVVPVVIAEEFTENHEEMPETPKPARSKRYKSVEKTYNWKNTLRTSSVQASQVSSKKSYNGVIEKFGRLTQQEKSIRTDKEKLLSYFKQKNKTEYLSKKGITLPKISKN